MEYQYSRNKKVLIMAIKSINDTMGPNGLVTSLLIFDVLPWFPTPSKISTIQKDRLEVL